MKIIPILIMLMFISSVFAASITVDQVRTFGSEFAKGIKDTVDKISQDSGLSQAIKNRAKTLSAEETYTQAQALSKAKKLGDEIRKNKALVESKLGIASETQTPGASSEDISDDIENLFDEL